MSSISSGARVWLHCMGCSGNQLGENFGARLADAGVFVTMELCVPEQTDAPGIICFDEVNEELLEAFRRASGDGLQRVIAAAACRDAIPEGKGWLLLGAGASDVILMDDARSAAGVSARLQAWREIDELSQTPLVRRHLVGSSRAWTGAIREIVEASYGSNTSILLAGETGTGKELAARLVHSLDQRANKRDLVIVDCTTIVPELSGSELFGHEKGAFTGAMATRDGAFALADGGTLFLDEVGELPLPLQAQLLRVLQEKTFKRVGGNRWYETQFRLVGATNRDLLADVEEGRFRRDLYYRLAGWTITLPPLRHRREDIPVLARHFLEAMAPGSDPPEIDGAVSAYMMARDYPGNVRDLRQLVTRIGFRHSGPGPITLGDIPDGERPAVARIVNEWHQDDGLTLAVRRALLAGAGLKDISRVVEELAVNITVNDEQGNLQKAAKRLGVTDRTLQMRKAAGRMRLVNEMAG